MATITRIAARIKTGNRSGAGTDGNIFLGIGGREFHLDSQADDFEQNSDRTYVMGESLPSETSVNNAARNDPRVDYVLTSEFLDKFPVYIRFEDSGDSPDWNLEVANNLWLGANYGKYCYLLKQQG